MIPPRSRKCHCYIYWDYYLKSSLWFHNITASNTSISSVNLLTTISTWRILMLLMLKAVKYLTQNNFSQISLIKSRNKILCQMMPPYKKTLKLLQMTTMMTRTLPTLWSPSKSRYTSASFSWLARSSTTSTFPSPRRLSRKRISLMRYSLNSSSHQYSNNKKLRAKKQWRLSQSLARDNPAARRAPSVRNPRTQPINCS